MKLYRKLCTLPMQSVRQQFSFALAYTDLSPTVTMAPVILVLFQGEVPVVA
jgi:hypothetical protein